MTHSTVVVQIQVCMRLNICHFSFEMYLYSLVSEIHAFNVDTQESLYVFSPTMSTHFKQCPKIGQY